MKGKRRIKELEYQLEQTEKLYEEAKRLYSEELIKNQQNDARYKKVISGYRVITCIALIMTGICIWRLL